MARLTGAVKTPDPISGKSLHWVSTPQKHWSARKNLESHRLQPSKDSAVWATLEGEPIIAARSAGLGAIAAVGFHPSQLRDMDGSATALLRHLLVFGSSQPTAWLDFENTLVLRMDDPGGAQNVHSRQWSYPKLGGRDWASIGNDLQRRGARLSVCYVAGWVDDGDSKRGDLWVDGKGLEPRVPGAVYPSPLVKYRDLAGHAPGTLHDYEAEYRGIKALSAAGLGQVELHGYTHMHPDSVSWAKSADRYESVPQTHWYRELGAAAYPALALRAPDQHPLAGALRVFRKYFATQPTTLVCPGDEWTNEVLERALDLGLELADSYYLAIRNGRRFCWATHVCAPYLDRPDAAWFDSGLPVVGYFHDYEPSKEGVGWMTKWLDQWQAAGAQELVDFRQLAAALNLRLHIDDFDSGLAVHMERADGPELVRPLAVNIFTAGNRLPSTLPVSIGGRRLDLEVHGRNEHQGFLLLDPALLSAGDSKNRA